jgi:hypothetical protein
MLVVYYLIESQHFNLENIIKKIKKSLNLPNSILATLFLLYLISTFYQSETTVPKFNLPSSKTWWEGATITNIIMTNYEYFLLTLFFLITTYLFFIKYFFKEKLNFFSHFKKQNFVYFSLVLIIPLICIILLIFKHQIVNIYNIKKLVIFFDFFNLTNLYYYFFVPLLWVFILFYSKILIRYIFIITIIIYTFLSIFIYNGIVLPGFFALEVLILFFVSHILLDFKNTSKKNVLSYLFMASIVIFGVFDFNYYDRYTESSLYTDTEKTKLVFKIKDLKELKKQKYLCPQDINYINFNKNSGVALSAILVKPYYSNISIIDKYANWGKGSASFATPPNKQIKNPCQKKK